jgi:GNAT superfamily N-acetyltransferase
MKPELLTQVNQVWAERFHLPPERIAQPGTSLYINPKWSANGSVALWPVGEHVVVELAPDREADLQTIIAQFPANHCLTVGDLKGIWGEIRNERMPLYALDADLFRPFAVPTLYTLRQLNPDDQPAFDAFQAQCSDDEREEGEVAIEHDIAFGVFDGERIVAASSVYVWRGFIDIGILTDPAYRGKGLGKAAVSVCCEYYLPGDLIVGYRHDIKNLGSKGIASGLGFSSYATADVIVPPAK